MRPNRLHCPIRHENGNCTCVGGFCAAVPDPVCEAVRNAYDSGWTDCALKVRKEQRLNASPTIEAEPKWISVNERLPDRQADVLVVAFWHECWQTMIGWHSDDGKKWRVLTPYGEREPGGVTHWMPLPEPPKEV